MRLGLCAGKGYGKGRREEGREEREHMSGGRVNSSTLSPADSGRLVTFFALVSLSVKCDVSDDDSFYVTDL